MTTFCWIVLSISFSLEQGRYLDYPAPVFFFLIALSQNLLVVDKPPSYLIYPMCGCRMNSLLFVLRRELGAERAGDLRPLHRLDKLTSGVCCLAKARAVDYYSKRRLFLCPFPPFFSHLRVLYRVP